jgi:hypothetical protein
MLSRDNMHAVQQLVRTRCRRSGYCRLHGFLLAIPFAFSTGAPDRHKADQTARIAVQTAREGCLVDIDGTLQGKTDKTHEVLVTDVEPIEHYVHVRCPGEAEQSYLVMPTKTSLVLRAGPSGAASGTASAPTPEASGQRLELRRLVAKAIDLRVSGRFDDAVRDLRQAVALDPENADLHRELGITFLMTHEWARARVEMLEAIRHDSASAEAHSGLGYALERLGDLEGALREYRLASRIEPDDVSYRQHYLQVLAKLAVRESEKRSKK